MQSAYCGVDEDKVVGYEASGRSEGVRGAAQPCSPLTLFSPLLHDAALLSLAILCMAQGRQMRSKYLSVSHRSFAVKQPDSFRRWYCKKR